MGLKEVKLNKINILLIGDSCDDVYHYGQCNRLSPEAPVPIFRHIKSEKKGGMAKNVYNNLINLKISVDFLTNSERITKERFIDELSLQHLMRLDKGEKRSLKPMSFEALEMVDFTKYDGIIISDYDKGYITKNSIKQILYFASQNNLEVFVDSKKSDLSDYENCIIKINEEEYENLKSLPEEYELIITMGKDGASWKNKNFKPYENEIDSLNVSSNNKMLLSANICGAGDTFLAGFVAHFLSTRKMEESIMFANQCASIAVENFGTYSVSLEDLR